MQKPASITEGLKELEEQNKATIEMLNEEKERNPDKVEEFDALIEQEIANQLNAHEAEIQRAQDDYLMMLRDEQDL